MSYSFYEGPLRGWSRASSGGAKGPVRGLLEGCCSGVFRWTVFSGIMIRLCWIEHDFNGFSNFEGLHILVL